MFFAIRALNFWQFNHSIVVHSGATIVMICTVKIKIIWDTVIIYICNWYSVPTSELKIELKNYIDEDDKY